MYGTDASLHSKCIRVCPYKAILFRPGGQKRRVCELFSVGEGCRRHSVKKTRKVLEGNKEEAEEKRPMVLKMLLPIAKIFFSEQANRRKSAMRKLREERKLSRFQAIAFGIKWRKHSMGIVPSICKTLGILSIDAFRAVVKNALKIVVVYPLRVVGAIVRIVKQMLGMKVKPSLRE